MATTPQRRGLARLVSQDGHVHWAEARHAQKALDGWHIPIFCDFCERAMIHYVARDAVTGRARWQNTPFFFATLAEAEAARDELAAQQPNEGE